MQTTARWRWSVWSVRIISAEKSPISPWMELSMIALVNGCSDVWSCLSPTTHVAAITTLSSDFMIQFLWTIIAKGNKNAAKCRFLHWTYEDKQTNRWCRARWFAMCDTFVSPLLLCFVATRYVLFTRTEHSVKFTDALRTLNVIINRSECSDNGAGISVHAYLSFLGHFVVTCHRECFLFIFDRFFTCASDKNWFVTVRNAPARSSNRRTYWAAFHWNEFNTELVTSWAFHANRDWSNVGAFRYTHQRLLERWATEVEVDFNCESSEEDEQADADEEDEDFTRRLLHQHFQSSIVT